MKTQLAAVIIAVLTFALQAPCSLGDDAPDPSLELEEAARILVRSQVPPDGGA